MSRPGLFKLMFKFWKTSTVAVPIFSFSLWYTYDYTITNSNMKSYCQKAKDYGDVKLESPNAPTRHITVILNPAAGKGKSKKLYEKWVEPLLHLAGIKVSLVETRSVKEAFELMKIMTNCDGVAIVGGDGTVHAAINGLLHRPDRVKATRDFPVAIIPTGQNNSIARYLHQGYVEYRNRKEFLMGATCKLVESATTKFDALKITPVEGELKQKEESIYALRDVRYGVFQDNFYNMAGFHYYQTYIKPIRLRLQRFLAPLPQIQSVSYSKPCIGCVNCFERHKLRDDASSVKIDEPSVNRKWWSKLAPINRGNSGPTEEEKQELELSKRENSECGKFINVDSTQEISDFRACMMGEKKVRLSLGYHREYSPSNITEAQDVKLIVEPELDAEKKQQASQSETQEIELNLIDSDHKQKKRDQANEKQAAEKTPAQFLIDGQPSQAHSIEITALSKAITVFTGPHKVFIPERTEVV